MPSILHDRHGEPTKVLRTAEVEHPESAPPGCALIKVSLAPVHPGDLQAISAAPNFGDPVDIPEGGRVPGLEGVGVVLSLADDVDAATSPAIGERVAFFLAPGTWRDVISVPVEQLVSVPAELSDDVAAHMLVDTFTAQLVVRAAHESLPEDDRVDVTVIQTGAGSAVGRLITKELIHRGVHTVRLVRSQDSADRLRSVLPGPPVVATDDADWKEQVGKALEGERLWTIIDGVGGPLLGEVTPFLNVGGTVINYGALGGGSADIRWFVPRQLTLQGVSIMAWPELSDDLRRSDIESALTIATEDPRQFAVSATYPPSQIAKAIEEADGPGRNGAVLLDFRTTS